MVEVFTTTIQNEREAEPIMIIFEDQFPELKVNFDFEAIESIGSCGYSILRVEGTNLNLERILQLMKESGTQCEVLADKICN